MINNASYSQSGAQNEMQNVLPSASVCTLTNGNINPPTAGNICVYAGSRVTGTSPNPDTVTLTAVYGYNVLGISGPLTVASQGTFPLD